MSDNDLTYLAYNELRQKPDFSSYREAAASFMDSRDILTEDPTIKSRVELAFHRAFNAMQYCRLFIQPLRLLDRVELSKNRDLIFNVIERVHRSGVESYILQYLDELNYEVDESDLIGQSKLYEDLPARLVKDLDLKQAKKQLKGQELQFLTNLAVNHLRQNAVNAEAPRPSREVYKSYLETRGLPDTANARKAFDQAWAYYRISECAADPLAHLDTIHPSAREFPGVVKEYMEAYEAMAHATRDEKDFSGRVQLFRVFVDRFNKDLPKLQRGMSYLPSSGFHDRTRAAYALKNDPDVKGKTVQELWDYIAQKYPVLVDPTNFTNDPQTTFLTRVKIESWFENFIDCFKEQETLAVRKYLRDMAYVEDVALNPQQDLRHTRLYEHLISLGLSTHEIEDLIQAAGSRIRSPKGSDPKQEAMLYFAARFSLFEEEYLRYRDIFDQVTSEETALALHSFSGGIFQNSYNRERGERALVQIGYRMTEQMPIHPDRQFWFSVLLNPDQQQIILNHNQVTEQASLLFEQVIADTVAHKNPRHPQNVHKAISEMATTNRKTEASLDGIVPITDQFESDGHRYDQLILTPEKGTPILYVSKGANLARPHLLSSLWKLAGKDTELFCLLQEMVCQNAQKMAIAQWLYPDLEERTGQSKIYGFLMLIPYFSATAVEQVDENRFHIDYDIDLRVNNQFTATPPTLHNIRVRYELLRDPATGEWIVQQPLWSQRAVDLVSEHKPVPAIPTAESLPGKDQNVAVLQEALLVDSDPIPPIK